MEKRREMKSTTPEQAHAYARRRLNNKISARKTREKKSNQMATLRTENDWLRQQLQTAQQQATELRTANQALLQNLPHINEHQR